MAVAKKDRKKAASFFEGNSLYDGNQEDISNVFLDATNRKLEPTQIIGDLTTNEVIDNQKSDASIDSIIKSLTDEEQIESRTEVITVSHNPHYKASDNHKQQGQVTIVNSVYESTTDNQSETGNKPITNSKQTGNKQETKPTTNRKQSGNKETPEIENWQQTGIRTGNTIDNKVATKRQQTDNKAATKTIFSELVGLQRDIIIFICHECKNSRSTITEALTLEHIAKPLKRSIGAVKTTIQRLEKKGCLIRVGFKNGRGGWSRYEVPDYIYHDALRNETENKVATKWQQSDNKPVSQPTTEPATRAFSSRSILNNKESTTELGEEWKFDIKPHSRWGFYETQLKQLYALGVWTADQVEQALIEFDFDEENNFLPKTIRSKIHYFMGILRGKPEENKQPSLYSSVNYRNQLEVELAEKARELEEKRKRDTENKCIIWEASLDDESRKRIEKEIPMRLMASYKAHGVSNPEVKQWFVQYYVSQIF
jgi:predicted transcriptional regulator